MVFLKGWSKKKMRQKALDSLERQMLYYAEHWMDEGELQIRTCLADYVKIPK